MDNLGSYTGGFRGGSSSLGEDEEFRNLGGVLEIYSAQERLPVELDKKICGDVEFLVTKLQQLSRDMSIEFEFELEGVFVGAIENGRLDKNLDVGLLGEWRRHLAIPG